MASRTSLFFVALLSLSALGGCHRGSKQSYAATPLLGSPIRIVVKDAYTDKERLTVETSVTNVSDRPMKIEQDNLELALDNGKVLGHPDTSRKSMLSIEPGGTKSVKVDFRGHDVKWRSVKHAKLEWSNAVSIEGRQVLIPPMDLSASGERGRHDRDRNEDD